MFTFNCCFKSVNQVLENKPTEDDEELFHLTLPDDNKVALLDVSSQTVLGDISLDLSYESVETNLMLDNPISDLSFSQIHNIVSEFIDESFHFENEINRLLENNREDHELNSIDI